MSLLVVGSVALDTIATPFGRCKEVLGGSATYFGTSASIFSPVSLVAVVGKDFPKQHINLLKRKRIDLAGLKVEKGKTFRWRGKYNWDLNDATTLATHLNVFATFDPKIPDEYKNSEFVFLANIDPQIQEKVLRQVKNPKMVACDTMNYWITHKPKYLRKVLKKVDIFFLNESEARQLTGETNLIKACRKITKMGPKRIILKRGEHGVILFSNNSLFAIPAYLMESIFDPTGAGDTFAGGVMGYLAKCKNITERNLRRAVALGNIMATFAVEDFSLRRLGKIKKSDVMRRFNRFKKQMHF